MLLLLSARIAWPTETAGLEDDGVLPPIDDPTVEGVVGGHPVTRDVWNDTVGIVFFGAFVGCTGTLVGPKLVLTAGHCAAGYPITHVLVGSKDWAEDGGELIEVDEVFEYPNSQQSYDIALVTLSRVSVYEPRAIGIGCILRDYLDDGAPVEIVGFGGTSAAGTDYYNSALNAVATTILDRNCDQPVINGIIAGCQSSVSPGGEIAAGGDGKDACFGDSGGPLYLKTDVGDYVIGVTSRAFIGAVGGLPCQDGGIWVRPDAVIDWIEEMADGKKITYPVCNEPPEPDVSDIVTTVGVPGRTTVALDDPDGDPAAATIEVAVQPEHGLVRVLDGHVLEYLPVPGFVGDDAFTVLVTDAGTGDERTGDPVSIELEIGAIVTPAEPGGSGLLGCGCGSSGAPAHGGLVGLLALLARRRIVVRRR